MSRHLPRRPQQHPQQRTESHHLQGTPTPLSTELRLALEHHREHPVVSRNGHHWLRCLQLQGQVRELTARPAKSQRGSHHYRLSRHRQRLHHHHHHHRHHRRRRHHLRPLNSRYQIHSRLNPHSRRRALHGRLRHLRPPLQLQTCANRRPLAAQNRRARRLPEESAPDRFRRTSSWTHRRKRRLRMRGGNERRERRLVGVVGRGQSGGRWLPKNRRGGLSRRRL